MNATLIHVTMAVALIKLEDLVAVVSLAILVPNVMK
jgi:hypothetical protein